MITNKDIRVENGNLVLNGDKFPLDGQSPETIMEIVEDNSDTTPTENSTAPVTSGGVYTALGTKQDTLTFDSAPTDESTNPVTSGGVYTAIANKIKIITPETQYYTSTSTNLEYTGVSVACPAGHLYIVRAKCDWSNANTQSIAVSDSSSDASTQRLFANSDSACATFMLAAGETAYIWGKWAAASRNAVLVNITDITL